MRSTMFSLVSVVALGCGGADTDEFSVERELNELEDAERDHERLVDAFVEADEEIARREQADFAADERAQQQRRQQDMESDRRAAEQYAAEFFRDFPLRPNLLFADELGLGDVTPEIVPADARLIQAIESGLDGDGWQGFLNEMARHEGRFVGDDGSLEVTPFDMEVACMGFSSGDVESGFGGTSIRLSVPAETEPQKLCLVFLGAHGIHFLRTMDTVDLFPSPESDPVQMHPSGDRWLIYYPICGRVQEGFIFRVEGDIDATSALVLEVQSSIGQAQSKAQSVRENARRLEELGEPAPDDAQIESEVDRIIRETYAELRQRFLGEQVTDAPDEGAGAE